MSKPVKNLIVNTYRHRFDGLNSGILVDLRGIKSNDNNALRINLAEQQIKITVVKNSLAKRAWEGTGLDNMTQLLDGSCALAYGSDSVVQVARALIDQTKKIKLSFKGALMEGEVFGPEQVEDLSKYPTREEAQAQIIGTILSAGGQVIATATSAGSAIASILSTLEEKLEKGETITKASAA